MDNTLKEEEATRRGKWVVRKSARGFDVKVWEWADMARTNEWFLKSCLYLYESEAAAKNGDMAGGSAALVSVSSQLRPFGTKPHLYLVTNRHVVEKDKCTFVRYNIMTGGYDGQETRGGWYWEKDDDLAVCPITFPPWVWYFPVHLAYFAVTQDKIQEYNIGIGDDVFMVSRFMGHEGKEENRPALRFGNISVMPDPLDKVQTDEGPQEAYLIEMRSVAGCSGSPVFWYVAGHRNMDGNNRERRGDLIGPLLLGIDCGHFPDVIPVRDDGRNPVPPGWYIKTNSGMAVVIPVWRIQKLLDRKRFRVARKEEDEKRLAEERLRMVRGSAVSDSKKPDAGEITPEGFEEALRRASRRVTPPEPEQGEE